MEANEAAELREQHEHATEGEAHPHKHLVSVSFTMSLLAVMVAVVTVMGHRSHTEAVLMQARASDQWSLYQAKKIRQNETQLAEDMMGALSAKGNVDAQDLLSSYKAHMAKWSQDLSQEQEAARTFEEHVERAEKRANHFDLGEALLEIGLVVTSITLLTRQRLYWYLGTGFGVAGLVVTVLAWMMP